MNEDSAPSPVAPLATSPAHPSRSSDWPRRILFGVAISLATLCAVRYMLPYEPPVGQRFIPVAEQRHQVFSITPKPIRWHDHTYDEWLALVRSPTSGRQVQAAEALTGMITPRHPFMMNCGPGPEELRIRIADHPDLVPTLITVLDDPKPEARNAAAQTLRWCGPHATAAVPKLAQLLQDDATVVAACYALGTIGPPATSSLAELRNRLVDPEPDVRFAAAQAVWYIAENPAALDACERLISDRSVKFRPRVMLFLMYAVGPRAAHMMPTLLDVLDNDILAQKNKSGDGLQHALIRLFGAIGPEAGPAVPGLAKLFRDHEYDKDDCIWALTRIGPNAKAAIPVVREYLRDIAAQKDRPYSGADIQLRHAAYLLYGAIGPGAIEAVPDLIAELRKPIKLYESNHIRVAAQALGQIGPVAREALPDLRKMLVHKDYAPDVALAIWLIEPDDVSRYWIEHYLSPESHNGGNFAEFFKHVGAAGPAAKALLPTVLRLMQDPKRDQVGAAEVAWKIGAAPEAVALLKQFVAAREKLEYARNNTDRAALVLARINYDLEARRTIEEAIYDMRRRDGIPEAMLGDRYGHFQTPTVSM